MNQRPHKRAVQQHFDDVLLEHIRQYPELRGDIFVLPGPWEPLKYMRNFREKGLANGVVGVENDPAIHKKIYNALYYAQSRNAILQNMDVRRGDIGKCIYEEVWPKDEATAKVASSFRGADLDFCETFTPQVLDEVESVFSVFACSNVPAFWIRLTTSFGWWCDRQVVLEHLRQLSQHALSYSNIQLLSWELSTYRDGRPMMALQTIAQQKPSRTLKDLSEVERNLLEVVMWHMCEMQEVEYDCGYTEEDVQNLFGVTPRSLAAWRAHRTMGH